MKWKSDSLAFSIKYDQVFLKRLKKLKRDSPQIYQRLKKKMEAIVENPEHFKPLGNVLKGRRRAHIGSFVVVYSFDENEKMIKFLEFDHHDKVY